MSMSDVAYVFGVLVALSLSGFVSNGDFDEQQRQFKEDCEMAALWESTPNLPFQQRAGRPRASGSCGGDMNV